MSQMRLVNCEEPNSHPGCMVIKGQEERLCDQNLLYRDDIVRAGMFNERCNKYGAMSQEVRARTSLASELPTNL